ncbi:neural cell adhesion molecule L1 [Elysia marginata]|uniref:Neural cell adhesion molecule L1 n=1 Tax=Elysia marginata TaxID=1093978 RepID=A0AAV4FR96_9GAST|nr:neural cell adhesion molecule L1 [Elysia marginata]
MEFTKENMRFYIFMRCKLGESAKLIYETLQVVCGDCACSYQTVRRWLVSAFVYTRFWITHKANLSKMESFKWKGQMKPLLIVLVLLPISVVSQACRPPSIVQEGRELTYFRRFSIVRIPCVATGNSTLHYHWTRDGESVELSNNMARDGAGTLRISLAHLSDQGYYQCSVTNECGTSLSGKTRLVMATNEPFTDWTSHVIEAEVGGSAVLTCNPPRSVPEPVFKWYVHRGSYGHSSVPLDDRITQDFLAGPGLHRPVEVMWSSPSDILVVEGKSAKMKCIFSGK